MSARPFQILSAQARGDSGSGSAMSDVQNASAPKRSARSSLKWRLSLMLTALSTLVFLAASGIYVVGARRAIGIESVAVVRLVEAMLRDGPQTRGVPQLPVEAIRDLDHARHIRAIVPGTVRDAALPYPGWFAKLLRVDPETWSKSIIVTSNGRPLYLARLLSTPDDEIAEKWSDAVSAFWFLSVFLAILNVGIWLIVYWQLQPLQALRAALESVGSGKRDVRVEPSAVEELAAVQHGFNRMAAALRDAGERNRQLTRELLRIQEEERRSIARELHDEFAQHVTAIDAEAAALAHGLPAKSSATAGVAAIRAGAQTLMRMVRGRLEQLRPEVLDEFGIVAAIVELCDGFRHTYPQIALSVSLPPELPIAEERSIAAFRILQESLTNVARHAQATAVEVSLEVVVRDGDRLLELVVRDNGKGLLTAAGSRRGFGLLGMKERLESLGGSLSVEGTCAGRGVEVRAILPMVERASIQ